MRNLLLSFRLEFMPSGLHTQAISRSICYLEKAKDTEVKDLSSNRTTDFCCSKLKKSDASKIVKDIVSNSGSATKYRKTFHTLQNKIEKLTPADALSIFAESVLTRNQYETVPSRVKLTV
ncbi:hypothetical protein AVEN_194071-1 [Araneus ventricosus]|uniref:Uncharacterized protein n=1 Tax=Araneus ventricosus TaxID=182803 RepID=A0A4Y2LH14_ARAVE|nr:hypothetical protein AVEN_194071-1 [Araneus ventricosus]